MNVMLCTWFYVAKAFHRVVKKNLHKIIRIKKLKKMNKSKINFSFYWKMLT